MDFSKYIAEELGLPVNGVANVIELLVEGATVPFISRYRKEATGGLNEVEVSDIFTLYDKYCEMAKRKETILKTIADQEKLTPELEKRIAECWNATQLEDIYLPFKPKRRTKASVARELGLEPLAEMLLAQREPNIRAKAKGFLREGVATVEDALQGAKDIIAEKMSETEGARNAVRQSFAHSAVISSKVVKSKASSQEAAKYSDYFEFSEPLKRCSSHRLLAMRRGESEGCLRVNISTDNDFCLQKLDRRYRKKNSTCFPIVMEALEDGYKRLLEPSIENEFASSSKTKADEEAIGVFAENLRQLLLSAPLGPARVLAIDPGFRTGCKVVCLDEQGNLLHHDAIFPHPPASKTMQAACKVEDLVEDYGIEAIAVGNGTAGRETFAFVKKLQFSRKVRIFSVSEDGASVYSASDTAREEFPDKDVTVRGAVSIGRRLMDPLAELVKIDPKSIGVGQYQHDVDQKLLKKSLDFTVESCVNSVGVNLNTASRHLLTYVSGLGPGLARNIVEYRAEHGPFKSRKELMKVPRLGASAFQQCAGFLRIPESANPLDNTAVHPESYHLVERMASDCGSSVEGLIASAELRKSIRLEKYMSKEVGLPTLTDIMKELDKPGRDPRQQVEEFEFDPNVHTPEDLAPGMVLPGIVTNITKFGAFVDVGVHQDGLIHVSQMADKYVSDPSRVVHLHQQVRVEVLDVDLRRRRIALKLRGSNK